MYMYEAGKIAIADEFQKLVNFQNDKLDLEQNTNKFAECCATEHWNIRMEYCQNCQLQQMIAAQENYDKLDLVWRDI